MNKNCSNEHKYSSIEQKNSYKMKIIVKINKK